MTQERSATFVVRRFAGEINFIGPYETNVNNRREGGDADEDRTQST